MTTTETAPPLAFRCSRCFQIRCSSVDCVGQSMVCELCGYENTVPEATEDRIAQVLEFMQTVASGNLEPVNFCDPSCDITDQDIMKEARQEIHAKAGPQALVSSKTRRFL